MEPPAQCPMPRAQSFALQNSPPMSRYLVASFARSAARLPPGARIEILASPESDLPIEKLRIESRYLAAPNDAVAVGLDLRVWLHGDDLSASTATGLLKANEVLPALSVAA